MNRSHLITPYKGLHYHLKEYYTCPYKNTKELFNLQHASLHNAI